MPAYHYAEPRSFGPGDLPTMEQVQAAIRSGDREKMLDLRDACRAPSHYTADGARHAVEALTLLHVALTMPADASGPQTAHNRPLSARVADARAALQSQMPDDGADSRRRAAEVRRRMEATR